MFLLVNLLLHVIILGFTTFDPLFVVPSRHSKEVFLHPQLPLIGK